MLINEWVKWINSKREDNKHFEHNILYIDILALAALAPWIVTVYPKNLMLSTLLYFCNDRHCISIWSHGLIIKRASFSHEEWCIQGRNLFYKLEVTLESEQSWCLVQGPEFTTSENFRI